MKALHIKVKKDFIIYLLIFFYPFLPVNYYLGLLSYANICAVLITLIYFLLYQKGRVINFLKYIPWFWIYLLIYSMFSFVTRSPLAGIATFIGQFCVSIFVITITENEKILYKIIDGIVLGAFFLAIIGIVEAITRQYFFQSELLDITSSIRYGVLRCTVTFGHPINFGMYQAIAAILCFYRISQLASSSKKNRYKVAYFVIVVSMILSVSRLAICFFVAVQMILLLKLGVKRVIKYICIIILAFALIVGIMDIMGLRILTLFSDMVEMILGQILGFETVISNNSIGIGNRFDLYSWVIEAVRGHELFGMGVGAIFEHKINAWFTKTSIEVSYLNIYYQCGIVGLLVLILSYMNVLQFFSKRTNRKIHLSKEKRLTFGNVLLTIFAMYYICLFGVQETDLSRLYCLLISLGIAYMRIGRKIICA